MEKDKIARSQRQGGNDCVSNEADRLVKRQGDRRGEGQEGVVGGGGSNVERGKSQGCAMID